MKLRTIRAADAAPADRQRRPLSLAMAVAVACWIGITMARGVETKLVLESVAVGAIFIGAVISQWRRA